MLVLLYSTIPLIFSVAYRLKKIDPLLWREHQGAQAVYNNMMKSVNTPKYPKGKVAAITHTRMCS